MNVSPVLLTVDGDTPHPHLCAGSEHPDGDLSPVGHQDLLDRSHIAVADNSLGGVVGDCGGERGEGASSEVSRHKE